MTCGCSVCQGSLNPLGLEIAETEVIPRVKVLLQCNLKHPFPRKYKGLLASCCAFGQVLAYHRAHSIPTGVFYTSNPVFLRHAAELTRVFNIQILDSKLTPTESQPVCEFNTGAS